jgi:hypothetical protein
LFNFSAKKIVLNSLGRINQKIFDLAKSEVKFTKENEKIERFKPDFIFWMKEDTGFMIFIKF